MAEGSDEEKTEDPTPQRLEKAREEGQLPRSRELATLLLLATGMASLWLLHGWTGGALLKVMRSCMAFPAGIGFDSHRMLTFLLKQILAAAAGLAPVLGALAVIALLAPTLLGGWLFSAKSIKVDPSRLNVFKGLKRLLSTQSLAELVKAIAKSVLVGTVAAWFIHSHLGELMGLGEEPVTAAIVHALRLVLACVALMLLAFIVVVLIDVPYQLWSHHKKLRMSLDEIKKEHKENEGDPQLKSRIRSQQQEMARKRMMSEIPSADVVVTNPTHFAVALSYRDHEMRAPRVVAKGADHVAARIRELATEHGVPQMAAPPLARALYRHADLDAEIPAALYGAVAEVLAWVYQLDHHRREGSAPPSAPDHIDVPPELTEALPGNTAT
ncbi:MAG: flagellar biosynthesis protein FlhB [Salinisphaera sp.]|jgi:flagellar biosynthetic protein FlhB|nr:flagellar biosynthesis protein FlhB [Salinisphaera sp.]